MGTEEHKEIFLKDYKPYDYSITHARLTFDLGEETTTCTSKLACARAYDGAEARPMVLNGDPDMVLKSISIDGAALAPSAYDKTPAMLTILAPPAEFEMVIITELRPQDNTSLEGLYKSSGNFCTQCEAESFRRITYFPDRPDVMTTYTTHITADKSKYPVLLSNGNLVSSGDLEGDKHFAEWHDPHVKPCYLFAMVAGDLTCVPDSFTTVSGKEVALRIYVQSHNAHKCGHAMASLKAAMKWDEESYGLEYDLALFNIVAVDDFNMGAMENKSLNIFNSRLILATPETATDVDFGRIEGVVAHEYFHNWTGNRVTCRDWFQLSLKEGLTVYRDQEFSADMNSRGVKRMDDVSVLRRAQFTEDAGPMAHPVRPASVMKMDNFYSVTVYEKGAEVVRMYRTLLGVDGFRKGMDLYFQRHDGQAVTCDDFYQAMCDANGRDLGEFRRWYSQAGTPTVEAEGTYDAAAKTYTLKLKQVLPSTPGQPSKEPQYIPIALGLLGASGADLPLTLRGGSAVEGVVVLDQWEQEFVFEGVEEKPAPSMLRGFSAPVKLRMEQPFEDLLHLLAHDADEFNRWEAAQRIFKKLILARLAGGGGPAVPDDVISALHNVLKDSSLDKAMAAMTITMPGENEIAGFVEGPADPGAIHSVRVEVGEAIARGLRADLEATVAANEDTGPYSPDHASAARRTLKNTCLAYLAKLGDSQVHAGLLPRCLEAANMTDQLAALSALAGVDCEERAEALSAFEARWKDEPLVMLKWLTIQATSSVSGAVDRVRALMNHPAFVITTPNCVYSLVGAFANGNPLHFHAPDGSGYKFVADAVIKLDKINGQVAARVVSAFTRWRRYEPGRAALMKTELERIVKTPSLTANVFEIASKSLADE